MWITCFPISRFRMRRISTTWILTCIITTLEGRSVGQRESPDEAYRPADPRDRACCKSVDLREVKKCIQNLPFT